MFNERANRPAQERKADDPISVVKELNARWGEINHRHKASLEDAHVMGDLLNKMQRRLKGSWAKWLTDNIEFSQDTAERYQNITDHWQEVKDCTSINSTLKTIKALKKPATTDNQEVTTTESAKSSKPKPKPAASKSPANKPSSNGTHQDRTEDRPAPADPSQRNATHAALAAIERAGAEDGWSKLGKALAKERDGNFKNLFDIISDNL